MPRQRRAPGSRRTHGSGAVYRRKDGIWAGALHLGYDDTGKRHRLVVYGRTEKIAEEKLLEERNKHRRSGGQMGHTKQTVGAYLTSWLKSSVAMNQGSWHFRRNKIELIEKTPLWKIPLRRLTREEVKDMVNVSLPSLKPPAVKRTPSWTTRKHCKDVLRAALNDLIDDGRLGANAASKIEVLGKSDFDPVIMSLEETNAFVAAAMKSEYFALFIVAVLAGLRQGELLGLSWSDLNLLRGTITIRRQLQRQRGRRRAEGTKRVIGENLQLVAPKTSGSLRTFKLPQRCVAALKTYAAKQQSQGKGPSSNPDKLVFPSPEGHRMQPTFLVSAYFHPVVVNARLSVSYSTRDRRGLRFHDLRHTAATLMLLQRIPHKVVMKRMGWTTMAMVDRYEHLLPEMDEAAAAELDKLFP